MNKDDLDNLNEGTALISNKLQSIHADLRKLDVSSYADPQRLNLFYYKQNKLAERLDDLKQAVKEDYVHALLLYGELANINTEAETLHAGIRDMISKYSFKYS